MEQIKSADYIYNQSGGISHCVVTYFSGKVETVTGQNQARLVEVQTQMRNQNRTVLMEDKK